MTNASRPLHRLPALSLCLALCLALTAACAPRPEGEAVLRDQPRVNGGAAISVGPGGVYPSAGVGVSLCNNRSPVSVGLGGSLGGLGIGVSC